MDDYKIIIETAGSYSSKISYYACSAGFEVYQISGLSVKKFAEEKTRSARQMG